MQIYFQVKGKILSWKKDWILSFAVLVNNLVVKLRFAFVVVRFYDYLACSDPRDFNGLEHFLSFPTDLCIAPCTLHFALVLTRVCNCRKARLLYITQSNSPSQRLKEALILKSSNFSLNTVPTAQRSPTRWGSMSMWSARKCILLHWLNNCGVHHQFHSISKTRLHWNVKNVIRSFSDSLTHECTLRTRVLVSRPYGSFRVCQPDVTPEKTYEKRMVHSRASIIYTFERASTLYRVF